MSSNVAALSADFHKAVTDIYGDGTPTPAAPAATPQGTTSRTGPFSTHEAMTADQALETFFGVIQAMAAIVNLGRFEEAHGDPQQNFCYLMRFFLAPLSDVYSSLSNPSTAPDEEGEAL